MKRQNLKEGAKREGCGLLDFFSGVHLYCLSNCACLWDQSETSAVHAVQSLQKWRAQNGQDAEEQDLDENAVVGL